MRSHDLVELDTYQGMPFERWKTIMVEHLAALRAENAQLERERNAANARAARVAKEGAAHQRAKLLQERLDKAVNTISALQRKLMERQGVERIGSDLNIGAMKLRMTKEALRKSGGNISAAAAMLGLERSGLYYYMRNNGLSANGVTEADKPLEMSEAG